MQTAAVQNTHSQPKRSLTDHASHLNQPWTLIRIFLLNLVNKIDFYFDFLNLNYLVVHLSRGLNKLFMNFKWEKTLCFISTKGKQRLKNLDVSLCFFFFL